MRMRETKQSLPHFFYKKGEDDADLLGDYRDFFVVLFSGSSYLYGEVEFNVCPFLAVVWNNPHRFTAYGKDTVDTQWSDGSVCGDVDLLFPFGRLYLAGRGPKIGTGMQVSDRFGSTGAWNKDHQFLTAETGCSDCI